MTVFTSPRHWFRLNPGLSGCLLYVPRLYQVKVKFALEQAMKAQMGLEV